MPTKSLHKKETELIILFNGIKGYSSKRVPGLTIKWVVVVLKNNKNVGRFIFAS